MVCFLDSRHVGVAVASQGPPPAPTVAIIFSSRRSFDSSFGRLMLHDATRHDLDTAIEGARGDT